MAKLMIEVVPEFERVCAEYLKLYQYTTKQVLDARRSSQMVYHPLQQPQRDRLMSALLLPFEMAPAPTVSLRPSDYNTRATLRPSAFSESEETPTKLPPKRGGKGVSFAES